MTPQHRFEFPALPSLKEAERNLVSGTKEGEDIAEIQIDKSKVFQSKFKFMIN